MPRELSLTPLERSIDEHGHRYRWVQVGISPIERLATLTVNGPDAAPADLSHILKEGARWWPLAMARELDDAILMLRANHREIGTVLLKTRGDMDAVLACDRTTAAHRQHWLVRETVGLLRRALQRLDVSSRSLFAVIEEDSALPEACSSSPSLPTAATSRRAARKSRSSPLNFGGLEMINGRSRLATRFNEDIASERFGGAPLDAAAALRLGLVTFAPDELDWDDEIRLAVEERASLSPDALTAMEANLRFAGPETVATKIFGRLSAWQNWVFTRPNATGEQGALKRYGSGARAQFDWERV